MLIQPRTLSLITTHKCTAACEHCCFGCTPETEGGIGVEAMRRYIDQAADIPSMRVVVFTGGECFLLGKGLDDLVGHATEKNLLTRFVSNGYWAASRRVAHERIARLKQRGLKEANFSTGDNHQKFVDPKCVQNGAMACADHGIPVSVMVEMFSESAFNLHDFVETPGFKDYVADGRVVLKPSFWMTFKGAGQVTYPSEAMKASQAMARPCDSIFGVVAVTPEHKLITCCGLPQEDIEELTLGDLSQRTLRDVLESTPDDFIKIWIHVDGPGAIIRYANSIDPTIGMPNEMAHICDVCRWMYKSDKVKAVIRANPPPDMEAIVETYSSRQIAFYAAPPTPRGYFDDGTWERERTNSTAETAFKIWDAVVPEQSAVRMKTLTCHS